MSIVEKAAEKLRTLQSAQPAAAVAEAEPESSRNGAPMVERLQARLRASATQQHAEPAAEPVQPVPEAEPWHVDERALQHAGWLPPEESAAGRLADEVRRVKRPILDNINGRGARPLNHPERIIVTSAIPGEGKTFTAVNLALSLALEADFEVLLVDGDIPKSDITRTFGLEGRPGLMELLTDERMDPGAAVVKTDIQNLSLLPAGGRHPLASELFGGRRMQHVLDGLGRHDRRRLLVFDSSPLLATSESQVLVSHMGQVVVVVGAGRTRQHELGAALEAMNDSQYVGLILNMSRLPGSEAHYYDHYSNYSHYRLQDRQGEV